MPLAFQCFSSASQDRLEHLIAERLEPGADKNSIDQRIWDLFGETLAVVFTDLSGFSRGIADFGVTHFLQVIYESHRLLVPVISAHDGILLKLEGDSMLIVFRNATKAVQCAVAMQRTLLPYNATKQASERIDLGMGVGFGRMLRIGDSDVFGAEVNAAAKLGEDTANAGEILVTQAVTGVCTEAGEFACEPIDYVPPGAVAAFRLRF